MKATKNDPVIDEVRQLRRRISRRCDNDPAKLVAYYMQLQEKYRDRLLPANHKRKRSATSGSESA